jgi:hypothetical protein
MPFSASYDRTTKIVSAAVCLGLLAMIAASHSVIFSVLALAVILITFAWSPRGYVLEGRSIVVRRLVGPARIALEGVREVRASTPDDSRGCMRLWGSGGLFGYYGLFTSRKLGKFTGYVTNRANSVIVITSTKTAVFSPDDVNGFLAAIRASTPVLISSTAPAVEFDAPRQSRAPWAILGTAVGMAAVGLGVAASVYDPGPPAYTLTATALTIHDRFYPVTVQAAAVDIGRIRIVNIATDPDWSPTRRINGFSNSHFQSGWFRAENGKKMRLYRAGGRDLVLLPAKGSSLPVLYQAPDPEKFTRDLYAAWGPPAQGR